MSPIVTQKWKDWWNGLSWYGKFSPVLLAGLYWLIIARLGTLSLDHIGPITALLVLYYGGNRTRPLFQFFLPLLLMLVVYDSQRYYADYIRSSTIHVKEPFDFDLKFFGIRSGDKILTPNQWFQIHTLPILDFITGLFYILFVPIFVYYAAYFRFRLGSTGTKTMPPQEVRYQANQIMWAFFWVNVVGYTTYYWYPASPPWYAELYGFGPARLDVPANPAGCVRFDNLLGTHIFDSFYGKAADVHGAIPSLHVAYPFQAVFYAFKFKKMRVSAILFYLAVSFSAIYLNHHYVLDVLAGTFYAIVVTSIVNWVWNWRRTKSSKAVTYLNLQTN